MDDQIICKQNSLEDNRFKTISDFKMCMRSNAEVEFEWNGISYIINHYCGKTSICEAYRPETEKFCNTSDEVLEYRVGPDRLRDVITQVTVIWRSI